MTPLNEFTLQAIRAHAELDFPRESCGLIIVAHGRPRYIACRNIATNDVEFAIDPADYAAAEDAGEIIAVVHSHPNIPPLPSEADRVQCETSGLPWIIINWPTGAIHEFSPVGYVAPLIGRPFHHGVLDCFGLCRDYYRTIGIELPNLPRDDHWWIKGQNILLDHYASMGFHRIDEDDIQPNDALLMQVGAAVSNHTGVYLGDNLILHHLYGRLSSRDVYGGYYRKVTTHVLRHWSLL